MEKIEFIFNDISDDLLAPGNIYWRQKSGGDVLISARGDILNFSMLEKLSKSKKTLLIENFIEYKNHQKIKTVFKEYELENDIKRKLKWRTEFNLLLMNDYYRSNKNQFEFDQLCWKLFTSTSREDALVFLNRDFDLFKRAMSIASSYSICAFLIGYYDVSFLKKIYNLTILNLMKIGMDKSVVSLKQNIEELRAKASYIDADREMVKSLVDVNNLGQSIFFEKFDGSGVLNINSQELSDLELILCSLNYFYRLNNHQHENILAEIRAGVFNINKRILNLIKRNFEVIKIEAAAS